jgi:hypothetical protein
MSTVGAERSIAVVFPPVSRSQIKEAATPRPQPILQQIISKIHR